MARLLLHVMLCTSCLPVIQSHSWLACADWDECSGTCHGYARNWHKNPSSPFATDVGRDIRPGADVPQGLFCDPNKEGSSDPIEGRYSATYPMAKVVPGQKLTWQWPAKNHADVGTQRHVQLYFSKGPDVGDDFSHITSKTDWVQRYPELDRTFSNCYLNGNRVGPSVDKAVCNGTFTVPSHLQNGIYTFMWWWEFNSGEFYNSCADVLVTNYSRTPCVLPTTTTGGPTTVPPANCGAFWTQCGGIGWSGATCCVSGSTCQELDPYYHQCIPGDSPTPAPSTTTPTPSTISTSPVNCGTFWTQCGGIGWSGATCCVSGSTCKELDPYYHQCIPDDAPTPAPSTTTPTPSTTTTITTPQLTTTPTTTSTRECKPFCEQSSDSWSFKCSWDCCRGCSPCMTAPATTTTTLNGRRLAVTTQQSSDAMFV